MKFGNVLFSYSFEPDRDADFIAELLREARLSDELGIDAIWLVEHHFSGICPYADPVGLASAIAATTQRVKIGFSVLQAAFHHPVKLAEQIALLDNISRGRMIMGLGRGNRGALYEYDAYRVDQNETAERLVEMEDLLIKLWSGGSVVHDGKHYQVAIPTLRPQPFSRPHPALIRSVAQDASFVEMARQRRPVLAAFGSETELARKLELYRQTMRNDGRDDDEIQNCLDNSWTWRHVFVAETNAEAERLGLPAFRAMRSERQKDSEKLHSAIGRVTPPSPGGEEGFIYGTPERVCETIAKMEESGIGGVVLRFRLGTMPADVAENNLRMFMKDVAPNFQTGRQAAFSSV